MFAFDASEVVETFPSVGGHFLIHYTRAGTDAVPPADTDTSGVPDFVELVGTTYEQVLAHYEAMGFTPPISDQALADNGGDGRFDVYLVDFAGQGDGNYRDDQCTGDVCAGYMIQENDFKGYGYPSLQVAARILASHEYFHAIQASYDSKQGSVLAEGTAVWGTETFDSTLHDFEGFTPGYFDNTDRPLDEPINGASDPFSYGAGIYFWFLEERYGDGMIRGLWERCKNGASGVADPQWFTILDDYLKGKAQVGFEDAFVEFATWNLFTAKAADPTRSYQSGAGYPALKMQDLAAPYFDKALRVYHASTQYFRFAPAGRTSMTAAFVANATGDLDGLTLLFAVERKGNYDPVVTVTDLENVPTVDVTGADHLVVAVVNRLQAGESKKPGTCVGAPDEVATCLRDLQGAGGAGGGSTGTAGGSGPSKNVDPGGCGCRFGSDADPLARASGSSAAIVLALSLASRRRRRLAVRRAQKKRAQMQLTCN